MRMLPLHETAYSCGNERNWAKFQQLSVPVSPVLFSGLRQPFDTSRRQPWPPDPGRVASHRAIDGHRSWRCGLPGRAERKTPSEQPKKPGDKGCRDCSQWQAILRSREHHLDCRRVFNIVVKIGASGELRWARNRRWAISRKRQAQASTTGRVCSQLLQSKHTNDREVCQVFLVTDSNCRVFRLRDSP
jgi:hypothetical protein